MSRGVRETGDFVLSSQIRVAVPTPGTLEVIAETFGDFISTFSDRLSRDGVLIPETPELPRGTEVSLKFRLSDGFSLVEGIGLVSEPKARGLGVHFLVIQSGAELVDKVVSDHLANGGQPFLVDSAVAIPDALAGAAVVSSAPGPAPEPEVSEEPKEPTEAEESVRELLVEDEKPAFAPGMVRLDGAGAEERAALSGLGSIDTQSKPLDGLGEESSMTQKISIPVPEEVVFQTDGEAQSELEAAVRAMEPAPVEPAQQSEAPAPPEIPAPAPPAPEASPELPSIPQAGETEPGDLAHLSNEDFASEIDGALDSAFGSEVDAALDAAFGPTDSLSTEASANLIEPSGLGAAASDALDASTRMVQLPDLTDPMLGANDRSSPGHTEALDSAAAAASDLLGGGGTAVNEDVEALGTEGLMGALGGSTPDDSAAEFPSDAELTPIPAPELEDLELPHFSSATASESSADEITGVPGNEMSSEDLFLETPAEPLISSDAMTEQEMDSEAGEVPEISAVSGAAAGSDESSTDSDEEPTESSFVEDTPSQLEMPSMEQYEENSPYGFEESEPEPSRRGARRGLIPLLLLALIGVGAWQVTDLVRKEFARLEPDPEVVARVTLEDEDELREAAFDSLLSLGKQEDGPTVDVDEQTTMSPITVLENVSWEAVDGGTRVVFAGDGSFSPLDTRMTRLEGENPRIVLKISGIQSPYSPDVLPVRTENVSQLRFGFHPLPLRNEVHAVFDLVDVDAVLKEAKFVAGRLEILIQ